VEDFVNSDGERHDSVCSSIGLLDLVTRHCLMRSNYKMSDSLFVFVQIPESIDALEREEKYERFLEESLSSTGYGELTGGGAMLSAPDAEGNRTIKFVGIDIELFDVNRGLEFLKSELKRLGAPSGTILEYTIDDVLTKFDIYEEEPVN